MTTTSKTTTKRAAKKAPAKKRGNMRPGEIKPLIMAARKAYDFQVSLGMTDGETFDQWRRAQCLAAVGKEGITACNHADFRPLLSHFQTLAGDDGAAFENAMKSGKPKDHAEPGDTHEARRQIVHTIAQVLEAHRYLAETSIEKMLSESAAQWAIQYPDIPQPAPSPEWIKKIRSRKAAIEERGKGPITIGYVVFLVRQKTRRPDLTLGSDWQAGLAERCTVKQLEQIHYTIVNRINALEGLGKVSKRNKSQNSLEAKKARATKGEERRW